MVNLTEQIEKAHQDLIVRGVSPKENQTFPHYVRSKEPVNGKLYHRTRFKNLANIFKRGLNANHSIPHRKEISFTSDWVQHASNLVWEDNLPRGVEAIVEITPDDSFLPVVYSVASEAATKVLQQHGYTVLATLPHFHDILKRFTSFGIIKHLQFIDENEYVFLFQNCWLPTYQPTVYVHPKFLGKPFDANCPVKSMVDLLRT